jgi:hypothetical protein
MHHLLAAFVFVLPLAGLAAVIPQRAQSSLHGLEKRRNHTHNHPQNNNNNNTNTNTNNTGTQQFVLEDLYQGQNFFE